MAEKRVSVRLAAVGGRQVRAELEGVGEAAARGFGRLSREMEAANARLARFARRVRVAAMRFARVATLAILHSGCAATMGAGNAGCISYAEARLARPPAKTVTRGPPDWADWIADLYDRRMGTLHVPGKPPLVLTGADQIRIFERLVAAVLAGSPDVQVKT
ncbi:MAG TPA: hypothetical protein ENK83_00470, partial [Aliiroseovarius sp.]|nr:hypothetical protein [Aliiroseovarius sp.]